MGLADRTKIISVNIPRVRFTSNGRRLDAADTIGYGFLAGLAIITLLVLGGLSYSWVNHVVTKSKHPPKIVTKIIHESALTGAQNAYIQQCQNDSKDNGDGGEEPGVPDVHTSNWTCTYAH